MAGMAPMADWLL